MTFIDADDIVSNDFIENLYINIKKFNADCAAVGIKGFYSKDNLINNNGKVEMYKGEDILIGYFDKYGGFLANKIYKKEIIQNHKIQLNEQIYISEDLLFNLEYSKYCDKIVYNSTYKYFYRIHANSSFYNLDNRRWFSVLDTYELLLENYVSEEHKNVSNAIIYNCFMIIYEAKYRIKRFGKEKKEVLNKIKRLEKKCLMSKANFNTKQKIKLFLFKNMPKIVMKIKRNKMKG